MTATIERSEKQRVAALHALGILDTQQEKDFTNIASLAASICQTPIALISMVDEDRVWFKAKVGLEVNEIARKNSLCSYTVSQRDLVVIPDVEEVPEFAEYQGVRKPPYIRFYAAMPIASANGDNIGTLCIVDQKPRTLSEEQKVALKALARQVFVEAELRVQLKQSEKDLQLIRSQQEMLEAANSNLTSINNQMKSSEAQIRLNMEQLHQLSQRLENSEKIHRGLVENAADMIYELDEKGRITFANPALTAFIGYSAEELRGMPYWRLVHTSHKAQIRDFLRSVRTNGKHSGQLECVLIDRRGVKHWTGQNIRFINDAGKFIGVARDITITKNFSQEMSKSDEFTQMLSANKQDAIVICDMGIPPKRIFVSPSAREVFGYEPWELLGRSPVDVLEKEFSENFLNARAQALMGIPATLESRVRRKDGNIIWVESNINSFYNNHGEMVGFIICSRDISRRKETESSLAIARDRAEQATRAKSQFLSMMSHEIRTPMNAIIGLTNILLKDNPRQDQVENLELLKFSGENLLTIINDILDFSKIEANRITLECIDTDVRKVCESVAQSFSARTAQKGIELKLRYDENVPQMLKTDPVRLSQVLNNLVGNAVKFTEHGHVCLSVTNGGSAENTHLVRFTVTDTGIGIDPSKVNSIFEQFTQADLDTSRRFGGTGLGLSITAGLLALMGSKVSVESTPGRGSAFSFILSLAEGSTVISAESEPAKAAGDEKLSGDILVVEDNRINQLVAGKFLKKWGLTVDFANDGSEALEMVAKNGSYAMILMDVQMPVMDGYTATAAIRAMDKDYYKAVPIIALTASAMTGMEQKALDAGMTDFLSKPFEPEQLRGIVRKYLHCLQEDNSHSDRHNHMRVGVPLQAAREITADS